MITIPKDSTPLTELYAFQQRLQTHYRELQKEYGDDSFDLIVVEIFNGTLRVSVKYQYHGDHHEDRIAFAVYFSSLLKREEEIKQKMREYVKATVWTDDNEEELLYLEDES